MHNQFNKVQRKINVLHSKGEFNSPSTLDVARNVRIREHKLFSLHHNNFMGEENWERSNDAQFSHPTESEQTFAVALVVSSQMFRETAVLTDMLMPRN